jgi:hypothetical protein
VLLTLTASCSGSSNDPSPVDAGAGAADAADDDGNAAPHYASEFRVVEIDSETPATVQLAVKACAGLFNRELGGSIYTQMNENDSQWLEELALKPTEVIGAVEFLDSCVAAFPKCVRYSYEAQRKLLPNILTVGAVLGAVPLDVEMTVTCGEVAFDATLEFEESDTPYLATKHVYEHYLDDTTGLAMLNPGYELDAGNPAKPKITRDMPSALVDFVFSEKLFVVFLVNGCVHSSPENDVLHDIVNDSDWARPVGVYGYNNSWLIGGYLYEAQTLCLDSHNMGAIPTETDNLSFFSTRRAPILEAGELEQNELEDVEYDPSKTYVAFVVGDGDNVSFIMTTRNVWLGQRLSDCEQPDNSCQPITWSISPHLARLAPDVLEWYFQKSHATGKDYFILPPSGHLYAYPTSLTDEDQDLFVSATEQDARVLGAQSVVHWDWFDTWEAAEDDFLPKYARADGAIRGVFPVNVPYMMPTFTWWPPEQFFNVLVGQDGSEVAVFRPREWRGVDDSGSANETAFFLNPQKMAEELGDYPPGTVTWVYMTSDGGLSLENSFMELVKILPAHVQLVSADTAARLALVAVATESRSSGDESPPQGQP